MKTKFLFLIAFIFSASILSAQNQEESLVNWLTIDQADSLYKIQRKPMLIDVYTDWCGWCKVMMKKTFSNPSIASYINQNFYPVRINAEKDDTLKFNDSLWIKKPGQKVNPLARYLLNNRLAYPTIVYLDYQKRHYPIPGYYDVKRIQPILVYFAENLVDFTELQNFINRYYFVYPQYYSEQINKMQAHEKPDTSGKINWIDLQTALNKKDTHLYFVFGYVNWCNSCKVMEKVNFRDKKLAEYVNKNFVAIKFDLATTDTIFFAGKRFVSMGKGQPNQFAMYLTNNQPGYPALIFLNRQFQPISIIRGYFEPETMLKIFKYFGSEAYKKMSFNDFLKKN